MILLTITYIFISGAGVFGGINVINYCKNHIENEESLSDKDINMTIEDVEKLEKIDPNNEKFKLEKTQSNYRIYDIIESKEEDEDEAGAEEDNEKIENQNIFYKIAKIPFIRYKDRSIAMF